MKALAICTFAALSLSVAQASDFTGAYARIEKVTYEPSADKPERIKIQGVFAMSTPANPRDYMAPKRGILYFSLPADQRAAQQVLREWADLKAAEGTGRIIAAGSRGLFTRVRVRGLDEKLGEPDVYTAAQGLYGMRLDSEYEPIKALQAFK